MLDFMVDYADIVKTSCENQIHEFNHRSFLQLKQLIFLDNFENLIVD